MSTENQNTIQGGQLYAVPATPQFTSSEKLQIWLTLDRRFQNTIEEIDKDSAEWEIYQILTADILLALQADKAVVTIPTP